MRCGCDNTRVYPLWAPTFTVAGTPQYTAILALYLHDNSVSSIDKAYNDMKRSGQTGRWRRRRLGHRAPSQRNSIQTIHSSTFDVGVSGSVGAALALTFSVTYLVSRRSSSAVAEEAPRQRRVPSVARLGMSCERRLLRWQRDVFCLGISVKKYRARDANMAATGSG